MYLIPNQASVSPSSENYLTVNLGREVKRSEPIFVPFGTTARERVRFLTVCFGFFS